MDSFLIFIFYVDDLVITGNVMDMIVATKGWSSFNFEMKDVDETNEVLRVRILRDLSILIGSKRLTLEGI